MKDNKVAIIILNYKSWTDTIEEISICNEVLQIGNEDIIVVDNCSPNESAEKLKAEADIKGFVFIASPVNNGYAAGNNIGLRYAYDMGYTHALDVHEHTNLFISLYIEISHATYSTIFL